MGLKKNGLSRICLGRFCIAGLTFTLWSCAELKLQKIADAHVPGVRVSIAGDPASLGRLAELRRQDSRKPTRILNIDGTFVVDNGTPTSTIETTKTHCRGFAVFTKIRIMSGPHQNQEGWICGAFITHHKVGAL
jgi:hypothetical protein